MNFAELKAELFARGTNYLEEDAQGVARAERWLNQAYREILGLQAWPFLQAQATGPAGTGLVSVPDLRRIRLVTDIEGNANPGRQLRRVSFDDLVAQDAPDLSAGGGPPDYYWVENGNLIHAYPPSGTIRAYYIKRVDPLSGTQEPLIDEEYHDLIVDRAMIKAYKDSDNFEAAAALKEEFNAGVVSMAEDYMIDSREVQYIQPSGTDG